MEYGDYLLGMDGYTPEGDPNRAEQTDVKDILDEVANNYSFVQPAPGDMCENPYP